METRLHRPLLGWTYSQRLRRHAVCGEHPPMNKTNQKQKEKTNKKHGTMKKNTTYKRKYLTRYNKKTTNNNTNE